MSFLRMPFTGKGVQWGEHNNVQDLVALGLATGMLECCASKALWSLLPGGLPYYQRTKTTKADTEEAKS